MKKAFIFSPRTRMLRWALWTCLSLIMLPAQAAQRVVSLGGDITGIVYSLGAGDSLVGVDSTSVWPEQAQQLPNVGYVRQLSSEGIVALRPDVVLATPDAGPPAVLQQLRQLGVDLQVLPKDNSAQGIIAKVQAVGQALGKEKQAKALNAQLKQQAKRLYQRVEAMPYYPRIVFVMSVTSGLIVAGGNTAADAAIKMAGGNNVVTGYSGYKPLSNEALIELKPDVILVMDIGQHGAVDLSGQTAVRLTPAGKNQRIIRVDGEKLLGFGVHSLEQALALQEKLALVTAP